MVITLRAAGPLAITAVALLAGALWLMMRDPLADRLVAPAGQPPAGIWEPEPGAPVAGIHRLAFDGERVRARTAGAGDAAVRVLSRGATGMLILVRGPDGRDATVSIHWPGQDEPLLVSDGVQRARFRPAP